MYSTASNWTYQLAKSLQAEEIDKIEMAIQALENDKANITNKQRNTKV